MNATLAEIDHQHQRYETVGDFLVDGGELQHVLILSSRMPNPDFIFLVQIHEVVEAYLCLKHGITQDQVDEFDMVYEANRKEGDTTEPGDSLDAPYYQEHLIASAVERFAAQMFGVDWEVYSKTVAGLSKEKP